MSVSFTKAVLEFFGKLPGQTAMDLQAELKALTALDRAYFRTEFAKVGIMVDAPAETAAA